MGNNMPLSLCSVAIGVMKVAKPLNVQNFMITFYQVINNDKYVVLCKDTIKYNHDIIVARQ